MTDRASYRDEIPIDAARLELAKQNLGRVDLVGFTDQYDTFTAKLRDRFGFQLSAQARMNAAGPAEASSHLRTRVAADNMIDVEFYNYARELVARR